MLLYIIFRFHEFLYFNSGVIVQKFPRMFVGKKLSWLTKSQEDLFRFFHNLMIYI